MQEIVNFFQWCMSLAHPDSLKKLVNLGGAAWVGYAILSTIVFAETGLLIGFFLPGDSLLFAAGFLASQNVFNLMLLWVLLSSAGIVGDAVNYYFGRRAGDYVYERGKLWLVKHEHLIQAKNFYEKYGPSAIVLARFVPIVRTFVPFVAGVGRMSYAKFVVYNVAGGILWVLSMTTAGYFLGQFTLVQQHFEKVVILIVVLSVLPILVEWQRHRRAARSQGSAPNAAVEPQTPPT